MTRMEILYQRQISRFPEYIIRRRRGTSQQHPLENIGECLRLETIGKKNRRTDNWILYFSIRATSPDESLATEWKVIRTSALDSKQHVRLDFQISANMNSPESYCPLELNSSLPSVVVGGWWWLVVVGGWYAGNHHD